MLSAKHNSHIMHISETKNKLASALEVLRTATKHVTEASWKSLRFILVFLLDRLFDYSS